LGTSTSNSAASTTRTFNMLKLSCEELPPLPPSPLPSTAPPPPPPPPPPDTHCQCLLGNCVEWERAAGKIGWEDILRSQFPSTFTTSDNYKWDFSDSADSVPDCRRCGLGSMLFLRSVVVIGVNAHDVSLCVSIEEAIIVLSPLAGAYACPWACAGV
jgi:hypothetical protein